jgi:hypothetical protein
MRRHRIERHGRRIDVASLTRGVASHRVAIASNKPPQTNHRGELMGWTIQHLEHTRSYTQIANLMDHVATELRPKEMRPLAPLVTPHRDGYFALTPRQAADIRDALRTAADRLDRRWLLRGRREARDWAQFARTIAAAADTAARSGRPWHWR